jgi:YfiH family protein
VAANGVQWLPVPGWERFHWLWHGFSTRRGGESRAYCPDDAPGELNLGFTPEDSPETVALNRRLLAEALTGNRATPLVTLRQIHSNVVVVVRTQNAARVLLCKRGVPGDWSSSLGCKRGVPGDWSSSLGCKRGVPGDWSSSLGCKGGVPGDAEKGPNSSLGCKGDGLMTDQPGLLLAVQTADCIPVLVADRKRRAVAAFHAGWRGTVQRIVESGVGRMRLEFGSRPEDLAAAIGPGIGACCYAVGEEVLSSFDSQFAYAHNLFREVCDADPVRAKYPMLFLTQRAPGHSPIGPSLHLDLAEANRRQLLAAGLKPRSIQLVGGCTGCQPELFFSHRASRGHAGRMLSVIGIRPH